MRRLRRAKIVATVGPASSSPTMLRKLFLAGVDTFRLNFSHGRQEDHAAVFRAIRQLESELKRPIGILQDLQGPKIRIGTLRQGPVTVATGSMACFRRSAEGGDTQSLPLPHPEVFAAAKPGQELLINDGRVRLRIVALDGERIEAEVLAGGEISERKGVNLPDTMLDLSPLTSKDREDLAFGLSLGVDWVALSFVQRAGDLMEARALIGDRAALMAKIEKPSAIGQIGDILRFSDAIMVARGDLGVEIPPEEVPGRQKELVRASRLAGKPVVIATQMLESMTASPTPTRAESSDVATAIYDGADAVMLSAESASGKFPVEAVAMMDRIIRQTEQHQLYRSLVAASEPEVEQTPQHAVAGLSADLAEALQVPAIVAFTSSGSTARRIARKRGPTPVIAVTSSERTSRCLSLTWGTHSVLSRDIGSYDEMVRAAMATVVAEEYARLQDTIVVVAGIPFATAGTTNNLRVVEVGM